MPPNFWIALTRGIGGLLISAAAIFAAYHDNKRKRYRR